MKSEFFGIFSKISQVTNFMKSRRVGTELFYADRRTDGRADMTKINFLFAVLRTRLKMEAQQVKDRREEEEMK
jgi:hypothetical protein